MNILIFGGTTEGRSAAVKLAELGYEVVYSQATSYVQDGLNALGIQVLTGIMKEPEIEEFLEKTDVCIDATHPFAEHISASIMAACEATETPEFRYVRASEDLTAFRNLVRVDSAEDVRKYLQDKPGNVLLTTGSKDLKIYAGLGVDRMYARVLPALKSLEKCKSAGIKTANIIAMQGPFSVALNRALMKEFDIRFLVTKESGAAGGLFEKLEAAKDLDITTVLIQRPKELVEPTELDEIISEIQELGKEKQQ